MSIKLAYQILMYLTQWGLDIIGIFLSKEAKLTKVLNGRRSTLERLKQLPPKSKKRIWAHAASLGEYQMLLPLLERLQNEFDIEIHVSFFSPSGFEHAENPQQWHFHYLQHDTPKNAHTYISLLNPDIAIFAKYEFWLSHLDVLNQKNIPFFYWNTLLRNEHFLTKFWAKSWIKSLSHCQIIFCQNQLTLRILENLMPNTPKLMTGDIRFLQTQELSKLPSIFNPEEERIWQQKTNIVWGSSWKEELEILLKLIPLKTPKYRFIIAPHDVSEANLKSIESSISVATQRLSDWQKNPLDDTIILVDGIGKLRYIYRYAALAIIGGGFKNALHNIIEPLSCGVPVLFGNQHQKFPEAKEAVEAKAALHARTTDELADTLAFLLFHGGNNQTIEFHQSKAKEFFSENTPNIERAMPYFSAILPK